MAEYQALSESGGTLVGICPSCEIMIYRRVSLARLEQVRGTLEILMPERRARGDGSERAS